MRKVGKVLKWTLGVYAILDIGTWTIVGVSLLVKYARKGYNSLEILDKVYFETGRNFKGETEES